MIQANKEWRAVIGYEGYYEVSNYGMVRSVDRIIENNSGKIRTLKGKILKQSKNSKGYPNVCLHKDNKQKTSTVHRLVATAFIPNPLYKSTVNHIDCDKKNNHVSNLEWNTYSENVKHAVFNGLIKVPDLGFGENHPASKLSTIDLSMIYVLLDNKFTCESIAKRFNVHQTHISFIKNKRKDFELQITL